MSTVPILPCPGGMDNVHADNHAVFQPRPTPGGMQPPERMRSIVDLDVNSDGTLVTRPGTVVTESVVGGRRIIRAGDSTLLQVADCLYLDGALVVDGLTGVIEVVEHADQIYWADWDKRGRIQGGVAKNWGADVCPAPIGPVGNWQIFASFVDNFGLEHGLSNPSFLSGQDISVPYLDPAAAYVRFYIAAPNDELKFWHSDVPVASLPTTITSLPVGDLQAWTHGFGPPPTVDAIISNGDGIVVASGNCLYPSLGSATHLYDLTLETALPENILGGMGVKGGFWVVTTKDAYWIEGATPQQWNITPKYLRCGFAKGAQRYNTAQVPGLELQQPTQFAMFMSQFGPAVGLPGGVMLMPFRNKYHVDVEGMRMSSVIMSGNIQQILFSVAPQ